VVTKLDGTSKGGMVVAIQKELGLPIKFIGLGEQPTICSPSTRSSSRRRYSKSEIRHGESIKLGQNTNFYNIPIS